MKLVLAAVDARFTHSSLALRYLRAALAGAAVAAPRDPSAPEAGAPAPPPRGPYDVTLCEYHIGQPRLEVVRDLAARAPDAILFSVYIWNAAFIAVILPDLRALLPHCRLILGGPEVSAAPTRWLARHPELSLVVRGSAEAAAAILARADFAATSWPDRLLTVPETPADRAPFPYRAEDWPSLEHRYIYYESSRGCPFACSYCLSSRAEQALSAKPVAQVRAELTHLLNARPMLVKFVDRTFNADGPRARAIWAYLIQAALTAGVAPAARVTRHAAAFTRFHFEVHPALLGEEDFALLATAPAGLFQFELGIQTIHADTRREIRRSGRFASERPAIARLLALGTIHVHVDMIVGLPGEDIDRVGETFDALHALGAHHVQVGFLKGLPGTALAEDRARYGMVFEAAPPYTLLQSRWLTSEALAELARVAELFDNIGNTHRFGAEMSAAAETHGGPFRAYRALSRHCRAQGFDIRTRNEAKLRELLIHHQATKPPR
jgi:radical SAM superfamily enzyme YgiQ (UPF0313 family)